MDVAPSNGSDAALTFIWLGDIIHDTLYAASLFLIYTGISAVLFTVSKGLVFTR